MQPHRQIANQMVNAALNAVDPYRLIVAHVHLQGMRLVVKEHEFPLEKYGHIYVVGAGKASAPMAQAMETLLGEYLTDGVVLVKYGHAKPMRKIRIIEAGHPVPDENTLRGTHQVLTLLEQADKNDLVIVLLSGGGSALLERLPQGISLQDLQRTNQALLACGANIEEINTIRKHISLVKGGRLAKKIFPAQGLTLILSDVIGDPVESIASGPTVPDPSTFAQAMEIVKKYALESQLPSSVLSYLKRGLAGEIEETPKPGDAVFKHTLNEILGNNLLALKTAAQIARDQGFAPLILTDRLQGEVREIAKLIAGIMVSALQNGHPISSPGCLILGGEPTVTLKGQGKGGRNQEMVLAVLKELPPEIRQPFYFCSLGTDGTDGPTDAAGAWIDQDSTNKAQAKQLDLNTYLHNNDSYHFFKAMDQLIITGPTGTNVMDLMFFLF